MTAAPIPEGAATERGHDSRAAMVVQKAVYDDGFVNTVGEAVDSVLDALSSAGLRVVDAAEHEGLRELRTKVGALVTEWSAHVGLHDDANHLLGALAAVVDGPPAEDAVDPIGSTFDALVAAGDSTQTAARKVQDALRALGGEGEGENPAPAVPSTPEGDVKGWYGEKGCYEHEDGMHRGQVCVCGVERVAAPARSSGAPTCDGSGEVKWADGFLAGDCPGCPACGPTCGGSGT